MSEAAGHARRRREPREGDERSEREGTTEIDKRGKDDKEGEKADGVQNYEKRLIEARRGSEVGEREALEHGAWRKDGRGHEVT